MKIYEDLYSNQYTDSELEIVKNEDPDFEEEVYDVFREFLTLDNYMNCFYALPYDIQNQILDEATRQYIYTKDIKLVAEIGIDEELIKEGRRIGDRLIDI